MTDSLGPKLTAEGVSVLKAIKMLQAGAIEGTPINKRPQGLKYSKVSQSRLFGIAFADYHQFDGIKFELKGIDPNILTDVENLYQGQMSLSKLLPVSPSSSCVTNRLIGRRSCST